MQEVAVKTHLIITNIHEEYNIKWLGRIIDTNPLFCNNMPIFVIIGSEERIELNTANMKEVEECAKRLTHPHGRGAVSTDTSSIYIKEEDYSLTCIGKVVHKTIKEYAPMYDKVGYY